MWKQRSTRGGVFDHEIPRVDGRSISVAEFQARFVATNQPVIVTHALHAWFHSHQSPASHSESAPHLSTSSFLSPAPCCATNTESQLPTWTLERLQEVIGDITMNNVLLSQSGRFMYFKKDSGSQPMDSQLTKKQMTFREFLHLSTTRHPPSSSVSVPSLELSKCHSDISSPKFQYYLYGEPLPSQLQEFFCVPQFPASQSATCSLCRIPADENEQKQGTNEAHPILLGHSLTSTLLWVTATGNCSPLHYDLSEGFLAQVCGEKRVCLFPQVPEFADIESSSSPPSSSENSLTRDLVDLNSSPFYPYPVHHIHDRQSAIDDIFAPSLNQFPLYDRVIGWQGTVGASEMLYIPYGWWHQVESSGVCVSVSFRWNPYEAAIRSAAVAKHAFARAHAHQAALTMYESLLSLLPPFVRGVLVARAKAEAIIGGST